MTVALAALWFLAGVVFTLAALALGVFTVGRAPPPAPESEPPPPEPKTVPLHVFEQLNRR